MCVCVGGGVYMEGESGKRDHLYFKKSKKNVSSLAVEGTRTFFVAARRVESS
jgi:hypothetical protein